MRKNNLFFILGLLYAFKTSFAVVLDDFTNLSLSPNQQINDNFLGSGITVQRTISTPSVVTLSSHNLNYNGNQYFDITYKFINGSINMGSNLYSNIKVNFANPLPGTLDTSLYLFNANGTTKQIDDYFFNGNISFIINEFSSTANRQIQAGFNISSINQIGLSLSTMNNPSNFDVTSIEIVPEPFSMLSLGTGLFVFRKSRRKKLLRNKFS